MQCNRTAIVQKLSEAVCFVEEANETLERGMRHFMDIKHTKEKTWPRYIHFGYIRHTLAET